MVFVALMVASVPAQPIVRQRRQTERGGRTPNPISQTAERSKKALAKPCGRDRKSIHHKFASKPAERKSPKIFKSENAPRKRARPRGTALQAPKIRVPKPLKR